MFSFDSITRNIIAGCHVHKKQSSAFIVEVILLPLQGAQKKTDTEPQWSVHSSLPTAFQCKLNLVLERLYAISHMHMLIKVQAASSLY